MKLKLLLILIALLLFPSICFSAMIGGGGGSGGTVGVDVQAYDAELDDLAGLTFADDKIILGTGAGTIGTADCTVFAQSILDDANEAIFKATVNLEIGTDVQAYDADLASVAGLTFADASIIQLTGTAASAVLTSGGNDYFLKSATDNSALMFATPTEVRTALALTIGTNVQAYDADLTTYAGITPSENVVTMLGSADNAAILTNIGALSSANISNTAYDDTSWNAIGTIAPSKDAIRDYMYLIRGGFPFLDQNASPDVAGEFLYDNTVAGIDDGCLAWYDDDEIRYLVDLDTLPSDDGYVVTYNSGTQRFVMAVGGSAAVAGTDTQVQFNDGGSAMGGDAGLTYNKTTDVLTAAGGVVAGASATPAQTFDDVDSASETVDAQISVNATDTGAGTEDVDVAIKTQVASTLTTIININADGGTQLYAPTTGVLTMAGIGATNNENLTWDFETTANTIVATSSTGVSLIDFGAINLEVGELHSKKTVTLKVIAEATALTTGDGKMYFTIPASLTGYNLIDCDACVYTVSSSGTPTVQIHNLTDTVDMLSTLITVDASEFNSYTAAAAAVIDTAHDDVATGDRLRIDVDVAGTSTTGLDIVLVFQLP